MLEHGARVRVGTSCKTASTQQQQTGLAESMHAWGNAAAPSRRSQAGQQVHIFSALGITARQPRVRGRRCMASSSTGHAERRRVRIPAQHPALLHPLHRGRAWCPAQCRPLPPCRQRVQLSAVGPCLPPTPARRQRRRYTPRARQLRRSGQHAQVCVSATPPLHMLALGHVVPPPPLYPPCTSRPLGPPLAGGTIRGNGRSAAADRIVRGAHEHAVRRKDRGLPRTRSWAVRATRLSTACGDTWLQCGTHACEADQDRRAPRSLFIAAARSAASSFRAR